MENIKRKMFILSIIILGLYIAYNFLEKSLTISAIVTLGMLIGVFIAKKMFKTEKEKLSLEKKALTNKKERNIKIIKKKKVIDNAYYILKTLNCNDTDNVKDIGDFKKFYIRIQGYKSGGVQIHFREECVFNYKKGEYSPDSYFWYPPDVIEICKPGEWMEILNHLKKVVEKHEKTKKDDDEINKIRENVNQLRNNI